MTEERLSIINKINEDSKYDDISYDKHVILKKLCNDSDILEILHNVELEEINASPEDYHNVCIFSYLKIPKTQSKVKNFICFEVDDMEPSYYNNVNMQKIIKFRTISHEEEVETIYGIDRQDLLALLVKDIFNWSNCLGAQLKKVYDSGKITENDYYYREIHYLTTTTNSLQRGTTNNFTNR